MNEEDRRAVARAVADTFNSFIADEMFLDKDNVKRLLYYHLNPWCTEGSFAFLDDICKQLKEEEE